ncbi:uncharacterized protein LOC117100248 [Anneissia japonica]|uniref:uncharacterized protein LOC117100248 n=1 Tax=Anneissia japonica TaxID=1529436 RepID=UPI0014259651|nr:uncharacterized protein LOC117100248 [Anneissia japonica]
MEIFYERLSLLLLLLLSKLSISLTQQSTDVSRDKSAGQSSTDSPSSDYFADLAVDGSDSTCSQTIVQQQNPYYWFVDLGDIYSVNYVLIYPENGNQASLIDTEVYVEKTYAVPSSSSSNLCGSTITTSTMLRSSSYYFINCIPSINGRYVFLYRSGTNNMKLTLCEVLVYGGTNIHFFFVESLACFC